MRLRAMLLVIIVTGLLLPFFVTTGDTLYTTPIVWSNKKQYDPSETAYLYGYGFMPSSPVTVTIVRPDLVEDVVYASSDEFGYFACLYQLDGIHGVFTATATDGINVAVTTFDNWLHLDAWWDSDCSIYLFSEAGGLSKSKSYYVKYFDPVGVEKRKSPTYTGVYSFDDNLTILPTFPNILGSWTVRLYENGALKRTKTVCIDRMVWTTDSTYTNLKTSFAQGETVYFKTIGLKTYKYYRFKLQMSNGTWMYVGSWTTGVTQMTGSYLLPSNAPIGSWKVHVREADSSSGACERHYVDACFQVTTAPTPLKYFLTVRTNPLGIGIIPGQGWYNACTYVNLTAPEFFPGSTGTRYRFDYWDVDGTPNSTGIMEISIHMNANHTATAHYITQYYLNLTTSPLGVTTPAGVGWYDTGTDAPIFAPEYVSIVSGVSRYRFDGWTTGDMSEIADPSATSTTVLMDQAKTVTANYVVQYFVTFDHSGLDSTASGTVVTVNGSAKAYGDLPYSDWVDTGAVITYSYSSIVPSSVSGKRFSLNDVTGPASPITVTNAVAVTGNYETQYYLTVNSAYGSTTGAGWYDEGSTAYAGLSIDVVDHGNGTRRVFVNWGGDASGTNYAQSNPITMNGPKTATATWKTQYFVTVRTSGLGTQTTNVYNGSTILGTATDATPFTGWFDQGAIIQLDIDSPIYASPMNYVFTHWTGDASGTSRPVSVTVNSPKDITANYTTQHEVVFTYSGLDSSATGTVVTVDGAPKTYGDLPYSLWVDEGTVITYSYSNVSSTTAGKRFILTGTSGPASPITVTSSVTVTGNYKTQFEITFSQSGVNSDFLGTVVTVDGTDYSVGTLPKSFWWDSGLVHNFDFKSPLVVTANAKRYVWTSTTGLSTAQSGSLTVSTSGNVIGNYLTQYYLTVSSPYGSPTPTSGWFNSDTSITASISSPVAGPTGTRYVCTGWTGTGSVPSSGTSTSTTFTITQASSITWNWNTQYLLTVLTAPSGLSPQPTRNPTGEAGPANGWWYNTATGVTLTAQAVTGYNFNHWDVDSTSQGNGVNPITVNMNAPHTATAHYTPIPSQISVTINPLSVTINVGQSVAFTSSVSGGTAPYTYQWYLGGNPYPGATSSGWTFTPGAAGVYYVFLNVTDSNNNTAVSQTAKITVVPVPPVGGYAVSFGKNSSTSPIAAYTMLIALFAAVLSLIKRKRK